MICHFAALLTEDHTSRRARQWARYYSAKAYHLLREALPETFIEPPVRHKGRPEVCIGVVKRVTEREAALARLAFRMVEADVGLIPEKTPGLPDSAQELFWEWAMSEIRVALLFGKPPRVKKPSRTPSRPRPRPHGSGPFAAEEEE